MDRRTIGRTAFVGIILAIFAAASFSPLAEWLTIAGLKESQAWIAGLVEARPLLCTSAFFLICVFATAVCFPAAPIIGISAGALFGFWTGLFVVLLATTIGSTIAFFNSRYVLRGWVKARFAKRLGAIDRGFERHGAFYLLTLRFNPIIPYWLVNLAMGVTKMCVGVYLPFTIVGLLPATLIYVSAGNRLGPLDSAADILSAELLALLLLLSLFPLLVKQFRNPDMPAAEKPGDRFTPLPLEPGREER